MVNRVYCSTKWCWIRVVLRRRQVVYCLVVCRDGSGCAALTSDGGWEGAASDCDHSAVPSPDGLSVDPLAKSPCSVEALECAYLLAPFGLLSWRFVKLFGFWPAYCGLSPDFSTEKCLLVSQQRLLVQTGRALQIGMGPRRMSKASESPNDRLCCRDSLRGCLV